MSNFNEIFPSEIILEILSRLPTKSVLESRSVCKTWKDLTHHPSFSQMHLVRLNHPDYAGKFRYVFMNEEEEEDDDRNKYVCYLKFSERNFVKPIDEKNMFGFAFDAYIILGSLNGLVCIYGSEPGFVPEMPDVLGPALIFNPVTKEYVLLPEFDTQGSKYDHLVSGFGYLAETNEYKVVRIYGCEEEPYFVEVEVYTLGSGKGWRHVGNFSIEIDAHWEQTHGLFLNGCLHWRNIDKGIVVVFDLADERFRDHIPPPPMLMGADEVVWAVIGVSGGGILYYAVCQSWEEGGESSDVWLLMKKNDNSVMTEQEEHQSWGWTKVNSLDQKEPFAFTKYGAPLLYDQGTINIFISEISSWKPLQDGRVICRQVFPHMHTLVSLKDLGEENAQILGMDFDDTESTD